MTFTYYTLMKNDANALIRSPSELDDVARTNALADEIATLSARLQASDYRLLVLIREFDESGGWVQQGAKTCAHWLSWRIGLDGGAAREKLRVARALKSLPLISESMSKGEISYSKVRAVTRVATPENETELLNIALGGTAGQVERIVRAWRKMDAALERALANRQQELASLTTYVDDDGMTVVRGKLPPDVGAVFVKALEAASEQVYGAEPDRPAPERRAEALGVIARAALESELDPGHGADRYQVVVHVDQEVLDEPESAGVSALENGVRVSAETSRRLACDATVVTMKHDETGAVMDVGRKTRNIPTPLRRALDARDPLCVWPGCDCKFVDGHHIEFWSKGGETKLSNLCNLCSYHHHLVHDGEFGVERLDERSLRFSRPDGTEIPAVAAPAPVESSLPELALEGWEGKPKWGYTPVDLDYLIENAWSPPKGKQHPVWSG